MDLGPDATGENAADQPTIESKNIESEVWRFRDFVESYRTDTSGDSGQIGVPSASTRGDMPLLQQTTEDHAPVKPKVQIITIVAS